MKAKLWVMTAMALLAAMPALARRDRPERDRPVPGQQVAPVTDPSRPAVPVQQILPPSMDPSRAPGDGHGRYFSSNEERRKLRRDINEAGRDIYRPERSDKRR